MLEVVLVAVTCFLAYSNGANDNFKGVASLFGSGTIGYHAAIWWATATTFAGSIAALMLAQSLLAQFSGRGIVPNHIAGSEIFLLAVALSAGLTVLIATLTGFPISTTHALTGGIVGAGAMAVGSGVNLSALGRGFMLPLALSPLLAVGVAATIHGVLRLVRFKFGITMESCVCTGQTDAGMLGPQSDAATALSYATVSEISLSTGRLHDCKNRYAGAYFGVQVQTIVDAAHVLSAGIVSFARGLNDTPKIGAMLIVVQALRVQWSMTAVAAAMAIGGLLSARRVAKTMSHKITAMSPGEGFAANLSTGLLVVFASAYGLPVSTTHVSVGSLFGIGLLTSKANVRVVLGIVLAWVITLPCAAIISAIAYRIARQN